MKLTKKDYLAILEFYNIVVPEKMKLREIKNRAENILASKLCKCIKKIQNPEEKDEGRAISICKKSVLNNKGVKAFNFTCKKKQKLLSKKGTQRKLVKVKKLSIK